MYDFLIIQNKNDFFFCSNSFEIDLLLYNAI